MFICHRAVHRGERFVAEVENKGVASAILCFVTIIGIPFGIQHLKLAGIALTPIGKTIVSKEVASAARKQDAAATVARIRGD